MRQKKNRSIREQRHRKNQLKNFLLGIFLGLCIALLIFSIWKLGSIILGYRSGNSEYDKLQQYVLEDPVSPEDADLADTDGDEEAEDSESALVRMERIDLASLQEINSEAIGWIEIPDTQISYPLVQTSDNEYYLTHTFSGEQNKSGSIFVETLNSADFSDLHTIIYGHNMKNGSMFAALKNYEKLSYFTAHPYVYIDLEDGSHCYQIFSCHEVEVSDTTYTIGYAADEQYEAFLESITASSLYDTGVDVDISDSVITLSTCTSNGQSRFVVHAKKIY